MRTLLLALVVPLMLVLLAALGPVAWVITYAAIRRPLSRTSFARAG